MQLDDDISVSVVPDHVLCRCGEQVAAGERAGFQPDTGRIVCLWCLADRQAGRTPPRRRKTTVAPAPYDAQSARSTVWAPPPVARRPRRERRERRARRGPRTSVSVLIVLALFAGAIYVDTALLGHDSVLRALGVNWLPGTGAGELDREMSPKGDRSPFAFIATRAPKSREPVTFSSCDPIHIRVNKEAAPPQADLLLEEAVARVNELSGLELVIDGDTDELASDNRPAESRGLFTTTYAPVLVAWTTPDRIAQLDGPVAGVAAPREAQTDVPHARRFVSGIVYLDGPSLSSVLIRPDGWAQTRAVVMHELGHLVGLGHVESDAELMDGDNNSGITDFGPGDRAGLRQLGSGPCF